MTRREPQWWLRLLSRERGAMLWLPGMLVVAWVVLFAIRLAPGGTSLFTRTTALRLVVGTWRCTGDCGDGAIRVARALERGLRGHGDVTVVDPARVAQRVAAAGLAGSDDPGSFLRAVRPLNAHFGVSGTVHASGDGFQADVVVYDARSQRVVLERSLFAGDPDALGLALADTVRLAAFEPHLRPAPAP